MVTAPLVAGVALALLPGQEAARGTPPALAFGGRVLVAADESLSPADCVPQLGGEQQGALDAAWLAGALPAVEAIADRIIGAHPAVARGYTLKYLARLEIAGDRLAATKVAITSLQKLSKSPAETAAFVLDGLLSQPGLNDYQVALMALVPLAAEGKAVPAFRIAHLRALLGCGKAKEARKTQARIVDDLAERPDDLLALAHAICDTKGGAAFADVARAALEAAAKGRASDELELLRFRVQCLAGEDANELGARIVARNGSASSVNVWLWYLLCRRSTRGRYARLGGIAGQYILDHEPSNYDMDTAALGLFVAGRHAEALKAQERALATPGTPPTPGMRRRLEVFRAVVETSK